MNGFFDKLERRTGWTWTVIGAGPDPRKPGGEIATKSFHYGETTTGQAFFQWFPSFDDYYMVPFSRFAQRAFRKHVSSKNSDAQLT